MPNRPLLQTLVSLTLVSTAWAEEVKPARKPLPQSDLSQMRLRVATYNILGGRNTDGAGDIGKVAEVIRTLNTDLIGLQEVDFKTKRNGNIDLMQELSKRTGLAPAFAEAMPFQGGSYGVGALSRLKIIKSTPHRLPNSGGREPRAALELECEWLPGKTISFTNTHLDHADEGGLRSQQLEAINLFLAGGKHPALLCGDLNAEPHHPEIQKLAESWMPTTLDGRPGFTWPSHAPKVQIDHLWVRPLKGWKVIQTYRADQLFPADQTWMELLRKTSDHLPVVVELEWSK